MNGQHGPSAQSHAETESRLAQGVVKVAVVGAIIAKLNNATWDPAKVTLQCPHLAFW